MPIIRSSQTIADAFVDSCWKLWQEKTLKPGRLTTDNPPVGFRKAVHSIMGDGFNKTDVSNGVIYAAYTPTSVDRSADVKRVIKVLSDVDIMTKILVKSLPRGI